MSIWQISHNHILVFWGSNIHQWEWVWMRQSGKRSGAKIPCTVWSYHIKASTCSLPKTGRVWNHVNRHLFVVSSFSVWSFYFKNLFIDLFLKIYLFEGERACMWASMSRRSRGRRRISSQLCTEHGAPWGLDLMTLRSPIWAETNSWTLAGLCHLGAPKCLYFFNFTVIVYLSGSKRKGWC